MNTKEGVILKKKKNFVKLILGTLIALTVVYVESKENIENSPKPNEPKIVQTFDGETNLEIHMIDVGQGDSILVKHKDFEMLIDAGTNSSGKDVVKYLQKLDVREIDILVGTHPHEDHIGGLDDVIKTFPIKDIYMPNKTADTKTFEDVISAIESKDLQITLPEAGKEIYNNEGLKIKILAPLKDYKDTNAVSIVLRVDYGEDSFFFGGDIESDVERDLVLEYSADELDIDFYKASHHGSDTSSSRALMNILTPDIVGVSVGAENKYGHPNHDAIMRFEEQSASIYMTKDFGNLIFISNGNGISVLKEKQ